jgi:hypothetical protein
MCYNRLTPVDTVFCGTLSPPLQRWQKLKRLYIIRIFVNLPIHNNMRINSKYIRKYAAAERLTSYIQTREQEYFGVSRFNRASYSMSSSVPRTFLSTHTISPHALTLL